MAVPVAGVVSGVVTFVVLTEIVHVYTAWSLSRERSEQSLMTWEKVTMAALAAITSVVVLAIVIGGVVLGWSLIALVDWIRPD
jgi:TRAP-type C4-dicarboxylate transport system permease large subunit